MRKNLFVMLLCFCLMGLAQAQQAASETDLVGTWAGSWSGDSNGTFELTITKGADGKLGGTLTPKPEGEEAHTNTLSSVTLADGKVTIKISSPTDEVEITLEATFDSSALKGTYSVRSKADKTEVDHGTIKASKKPSK